MTIFTVPIIPTEVAKSMDAYRDSEDGLGPKVACPNIQPKIIKIDASSKREAITRVLKLNPGWSAHETNIMRARDD